MNENMAALGKGAISVIVVVGVLIGGIATLFHTRSPDYGAPSHGTASASTQVQEPAGAAAITTAAAPDAAASAATKAAPPAASNAAPATGPDNTVAGPSAATPPIRPPVPPTRTSMDFSPTRAPWEKVLAHAESDSQAGATLATSGKPAAGVAACASCHGDRGVPAPGTPFPILAGASAQYLAKQLMDFQEGTRQNPIMAGIAKALDDTDVAAVATYYANQHPPEPRIPEFDAKDRAQTLQSIGDNALALAACANCHGANGEGEPPSLPRLAQQPQAYLNAQLQAFRSGQRANDTDAVMRSIAKRLSPEDAAALAKYYAGMRAQ